MLCIDYLKLIKKARASVKRAYLRKVCYNRCELISGIHCKSVLDLSCMCDRLGLWVFKSLVQYYIT